MLDQAFVMLHAGSAIHTFTTNAAAALGRHLDVRIQVRSFEAVCRMVGAGVGIGLVPRGAALQVAGLSEPPVLVELDEPWAQRDLQICVRKGSVLTGALPQPWSHTCARALAPLLPDFRISLQQSLPWPHRPAAFCAATEAWRQAPPARPVRARGPR